MKGFALFVLVCSLLLWIENAWRAHREHRDPFPAMLLAVLSAFLAFILIR